MMAKEASHPHEEAEMRRIVTTALMALALLPGGILRAQSVVSVGGELMGLGDETLTLAGGRAATLEPGQPSVDFGLQLMPELLGEGGVGLVSPDQR